MAKPKSNKKSKPFRDMQDRFQDDPAYLARGVEDGELPGEDDRLSRRQEAWDAGSNSKVSRGSRSKKGRQ